jgi:hypothetical protein
MYPFPDLSAGWRLGLSWRSVYRGAVCQRDRGRCAQFIQTPGRYFCVLRFVSYRR